VTASRALRTLAVTLGIGRLRPEAVSRARHASVRCSEVSSQQYPVRLAIRAKGKTRPRRSREPADPADPSISSASRPSRCGSARHAGRPPGTTRPSRPYPTGTAWPNRHPSPSSTSRCSGNRLPSPGRARDASLPALACARAPGKPRNPHICERQVAGILPGDPTRRPARCAVQSLSEVFLQCYRPRSPNRPAVHAVGLPIRS